MMRGGCFVWQSNRDPELYEALKATVLDMLSVQDGMGRFSTYSPEKEFDGWDIWGRKYIGLGTLVNGLGCGFIITFFYDIIAGWFGPAEQLPIQLLWVVIAVPVTAFGCSLYQTADLGVAPYDSLALALQDHLHKPYFGCRVFTDALCAVITFLLGGLVGIGTLVCAFGLGPFIQFFNGAFSEKILQYKPVETS